MARRLQAMLLSGGAASGVLVMAGISATGPNPKQPTSITWGQPTSFAGAPIKSLVPTRVPTGLVLTAGTQPLAYVVANETSVCWKPRPPSSPTTGSVASTRFSVMMSVANFATLGDGAVVTLRYHISRDRGWVNGLIKARLNGALWTQENLGETDQEAEMRLPITIEKLRQDRRLDIEVALLTCSRRGGEGTLTLDTVEIAP
ncbi:hypothetical protein EWE75_17000 [Sphingomonas populi]|uniref:Uncharacterized protein n=1 Tax=Sphingomonas populi TaxID=2484750 RepID=A0A4Q6XTP8_9SPHN|nr:hypothetical protein [Sphingomonas populi]RZF63245.1 hypothetical protein EWE75_17000 [Sphingomonas populi]